LNALENRLDETRARIVVVIETEFSLRVAFGASQGLHPGLGGLDQHDHRVRLRLAGGSGLEKFVGLIHRKPCD